MTDENYDDLRIEGRNPVLEALNHDKTIDKILIRNGEPDGTLKQIIYKAREKGIVIQVVDKRKLDEMAQSTGHQGVIAICPVHEYADVEDILEKARIKNEPPFIIILDGITDPYNLGAVIRTANACGAHGVIIPKRRAVGLTGIVGKASAGAIWHVPIAKVTNIARTIDDLKKLNIWAVCADISGESMYKCDLKGALALVIGSEGEGVSRLVREKCDFSVKIPMYGEISSLNASVAAGLLMYEAVRQRRLIREADCSPVHPGL